MSLSEIEFLLFLPLVWCLHWVLPRRAGFQNAVLVIASYAFYATWNWRFLGLVLGGTILDWVVVRRLAASPSARSFARRVLLVLSIGASLAALVAFKYVVFLAGSTNELLRRLGLVASVPVLQLALPLGISFYTLQRIGYVLDVYWGRAAAPRSPLSFALFCCYFPQLTAGPIARGQELLAQLEVTRRWDVSILARGAGAFATGLALKAWAADAIGTQWVTPVFANPSAWGAVAHVFALVGFLFQVFGDFAGYSLMAAGVSWWFGIGLPENFRFPLVSTSLPELWRRWHITLNRWLFDYVFTPLTTGRGVLHGQIAAGLVVTFLVSGLWHGAAWTFVLWGGLHGLGMVVHQAWDSSYRGWCRTNRRLVTVRASRGYAFMAWALTMGFFLLTLIPFRAASLEDALSFSLGLLGRGGERPPNLGELGGLSALSGAAFIVAYHCASLPVCAPLWRAWAAVPPVGRGVAYGLAAVFLLIVMPVGSGAFIYQQY